MAPERVAPEIEDVPILLRSCTRRGVAIDLVVERKKLQEIAGNVVDGSLLLTLGELATARRAAIVVEDRWADVFRLDHVSPSMVAEMLAAVHRTTDGSHLVTDELAAAHAFPARPTPRPTTPQEPT